MDEQKCRMGKIEDVRQFCINSNEGRGIWKVIDENRQLLGFIKQNEPGLLERYCWLEGWIARTDIFLNNMRILQNISEEPFWGGGGFPRKWPGEYDISTCFISSEAARCKSSDTEQRGQSRGNDRTPWSIIHCIRVIPSLIRNILGAPRTKSKIRPTRGKGTG